MPEMSDEQLQITCSSRSDGLLQQPLVYILIPVHNNWWYTEKCLQSLSLITYYNYRIIVINDGSIDNTSKNLKELYPNVIEIKGDGNLWWAGSLNAGIRYLLDNHLNPDYVLTLNNDVVVDADFLNYLVEFGQRNEQCIVGSKILYESDRRRIYQFGTDYNSNLGGICLQFHNCIDNEEFEKNSEVETLTGMSVLIPFKVFKTYRIYYDEKHFPMYYADNDFVLIAKRAGYRAFVVGKSKVYGFIDNTICKAGPDWSFFQLLKFINSPRSYWHPKLAIRFYHRHYNVKIFSVANLMRIISLIGFILKHCLRKYKVFHVIRRFVLSVSNLGNHAR